MTTHSGDAGTLSEAAAPEDFLDRVKALDYGEVARLAGGVAVMRAKTSDDREVFQIGRPSTYNRERMSFDEGQDVRTPEQAVKAAFLVSARSSDPDSIGGEDRIETYGEYLVDGSVAVRVRGFDETGRALVREPGATEGRPVPVAKLARKPKAAWLGEAEAERVSEREVLTQRSAASGTLERETLALLEAEGLVGDGWGLLSESAKTAGYSTKHAPKGSSSNGKNWIENDKPGGKGQMPAYVTNVRNAIMRSGKTIGEATQIALGRIRGWAAGKGDVSPEVRAASSKAIAEWDAMRARAKAKRGGKLSEEAFWAEECRGVPVRGAR